MSYFTMQMQGQNQQILNDVAKYGHTNQPKATKRLCWR